MLKVAEGQPFVLGEFLLDFYWVLKIYIKKKRCIRDCDRSRDTVHREKAPVHE